MSMILLGILRMPPNLWTNDPISVQQRLQAYHEAADEIERLQIDLDEAQSRLREADLLFVRAEEALAKVQRDVIEATTERDDARAAARAMLAETREYDPANSEPAWLERWAWLGDTVEGT
jgi:hypothetical protein